ncbi:hypothetical protein KBE46_03375 [Candidatus Saccharibacteria bacterium]|jgi:hypothetical protein|nr:hypothetical protein [Candidatus Saccharibacteria bacterium]MBP9552545.1 hypothetical protein [Candidatus Saccharibacteria bacterium]
MKKLTNEKIDQINRKSTGILIMVIGLVLIFGVALLARFADLAVVRNKLQVEGESKKNNSITISGQTTCLPLRQGRKASGNCELGIKTDSGEYYAVNSIQNPLEIYGEVGSSTVEISGELVKAGSDENYDIVGTIIP